MYTQNIDETTPAGTEDAKTADDQLRALKRDIKERLNSFFVDYNTDPLRMKSGVAIDAEGGASVQIVSRIAGVDVGMIGANATQLKFNSGSRVIILPSTGVPPAAGIHNNGLIVDDTVGKIVFYANGLRYYLDATPF